MAICVTDRDVSLLFGQERRNEGLLSSALAADVSAIRIKRELDLKPLKGLSLVIKGSEFWGLCSSTDVVLSALKKYSEYEILLIPFVPSDSGRWSCFPPPSLIDDICQRITSDDVHCFSLYVSGLPNSSLQNTEVTWTVDCKCRILNGNDISSTITDNFIGENNINKFITCVCCILDVWDSDLERETKLDMIKAAICEDRSSVKLCSDRGDMAASYRYTNDGMQINVISGFTDDRAWMPHINTSSITRPESLYKMWLGSWFRIRPFIRVSRIVPRVRAKSHHNVSRSLTNETSKTSACETVFDTGSVPARRMQQRSRLRKRTTAHRDEKPRYNEVASRSTRGVNFIDDID
ncbi:hypothetical protein [Psittacid alphaherpesvirus 5]|uniref:Uncharacterized protein n=1 Tax=Psittacid alphaherpesvirus 5 TaxID=2972693 RepID=A0A5P9JRT2_9ALPH|nr:hypothetical protein QKU09_gp14 [Psittacid alphaherpesvirus 5]QFU14558.1 hypothetical protein [Psittacid alphaherpesvirus 5]UOO01029.1 hypothetical protein [Psittacid alphaherpesvirus 5]